MPTQGIVLVLEVNRYGGAVDGNHGIMSGNATAAPSRQPAFESFVVQAKFYGDILEK